MHVLKLYSIPSRLQFVTFLYVMFTRCFDFFILLIELMLKNLLKMLKSIIFADVFLNSDFFRNENFVEKIIIL